MLKEKSFGDVSAFITGRGIGDGFIFPVYCYLVDDLLVDTGAPVAAKAFRGAIDDVPIATVVNTHAHEDHIGNNLLVAQRKGAKIYAHAKALPILRDPSQLHLRFYQRFAWGLPLPSEGAPVPPEIRTRNHAFQVIETPGHCPDHVCLFEASQGWLFCGDLQPGKKVLNFQPHDDFHQILASLKRLAALPIRDVFCAHQGHLPNGLEAIKEKVASMEEAQEKVEQLHAEKVPLKKIVREALGKEDLFALITRGHMAKLNCVKSILHLQ